MPDWQHEIRARLALLQFPPDRERSIVEELSQTRRRPRRPTMVPPAPDANKRRHSPAYSLLMARSGCGAAPAAAPHLRYRKRPAKDDTGASGACDGPPALKTVS